MPQNSIVQMSHILGTFSIESRLSSQFKHVFWVLKRTVSVRRFFWVPTTYV